MKAAWWALGHGQSGWSTGETQAPLEALPKAEKGEGTPGILPAPAL